MDMSDEGEDYDPGDIEDLLDVLLDAFGRYDQSKGHNRATPKRIDVKGQVEWAGEFQGPGGVRAVNLGRGVNLDLAPVREALKLKSYKAKGWQAQLRQLNTVKRGTSAKQAAGLNPSRETLRRWENGSQKPGKANRERIAQAYGNLQTPRTPAQKARVAQAFTDALYNAYGSVVRLRDIERFKFDD
jgi:transcriptional regulator with XRE-family HTH domain